MKIKHYWYSEFFECCFGITDDDTLTDEMVGSLKTHIQEAMPW